MKAKAPKGIVIYPHGVIEEQSLTVESSVTWGKSKGKTADPAWLTPSSFRLSQKGKFALLPSLSITSIPLPGDTTIIATEEMMTRAYKERYQTTMDNAQGMNRDQSQMFLMMLIGGLTFALMVVMVAMGLPQAIENFRS